jgi:TonB family protein
MILAIIQSSAILLVAMCSTALMRRQSAAMRHLILTAGIAGSLTVPLLDGVLPDFHFAPTRALEVFVQDQTDAFWQWNAGVNGEKPAPTDVSAEASVSNHPFRPIWLAGFDAKDYAAHLLDLARTLRNSDRVWSPVLAMSRPPNLERRFVAMLNPSLNRRVMSRAAVLAICLIAVSVTLSLASMRGPERLPQAASLPVMGVRVSVPTSNAVAPEDTFEKEVNRLVRAGASAPRSALRLPSAEAKPAAPAPATVQGLADGSLLGTVSDATGAVVPGVRLTVATRDQKAIVEKNGAGVSVRVLQPPTTMLETTSGPAGEYEFRALTPGLYVLTASLPGFLNASTGVEIKPSETWRQNIGLSVGNIVQRVEVHVAGQPKPAPLPGTPQRIRVGGNVQAANLISQVRPIYPQAARDAGIEGTVHLRGIISVDGTLVGLHVISSNDPDLAVAAIESARQWRYRPTLLNGEPVEVITEIDVDFKLNQ